MPTVQSTQYVCLCNTLEQQATTIAQFKMPTVISIFLHLNKAIAPVTSKIMLTLVSSIGIQCYSKSDAAYYFPKNADE